MHVKGAAARCRPAGRVNPCAGCLDDLLDREVDVTLPGVHDAAGEEEHVLAGSAETRSADREPRGKAQPAAGNEAQPLEDGEHAGSEPEQPGSTSA